MGQTESKSSTPAFQFNPNPEYYEEFIDFETEMFAQGRFRLAYMGTWVRPKSREGQKCVVKHLKESYTWKPSDWDTTIKVYDVARNFAQGFSRFTNAKRTIKFVDVHVMKCLSSHGQINHGPKRKEYNVVEEYIPGRYTKWCNNFNYWNDTESSTAYMQAFSHWSWCHTQGESMIADLQGVYSNYQYTLTDPAVLSLSNEYDSSDMGLAGIIMLLLNHTCNGICKSLKKPSKNAIKSCLSDEELQNYMKIAAKIGTSTGYAHEIKTVINDSTKHKLSTLLRSIAKS